MNELDVKNILAHLLSAYSEAKGLKEHCTNDYLLDSFYQITLATEKDTVIRLWNPCSLTDQCGKGEGVGGVRWTTG